MATLPVSCAPGAESARWGRPVTRPRAACFSEAGRQVCPDETDARGASFGVMPAPPHLVTEPDRIYPPALPIQVVLADNQAGVRRCL